MITLLPIQAIRSKAFALTLSFVLGLIATNLFAQNYPQESQVDRLQRQIAQLQAELDSIRSQQSDPFQVSPNPNLRLPEAGNGFLDPNSSNFLPQETIVEPRGSAPVQLEDQFAPNFDPNQPRILDDQALLPGRVGNTLPQTAGIIDDSNVSGFQTGEIIQQPIIVPETQGRIVHRQTVTSSQVATPSVIVSRPVTICPRTGRACPATLPDYVRQTSFRVAPEWDYMDELRAEDMRDRYRRGPCRW